MVRLAAVFVALPLAFVGCGAAKSESAQVRTVVQRYESALVNGDGYEMCALLTTEAQRRLATLAAPVAAAPHGVQVRGCVRLGNLVRSIRNPTASSRISQTRIGAPKVAGDKASVLVREPGKTAREITLTKTRTGWKISLPPASTSPSFDPHGGPAAITVEPPQTVAHAGGETLSQFKLGRTVAAQSGCLACHRIGEAGNAGPGPDLTYVGSRLPRAAIERALINPTAPMPSFRLLPKAKLRAVVAFLSLLRE